MSWIVNDSEDEGDFSMPPHPINETHSTISEFSTRDIILPTENASVISEFTNDSTTKTADTSIDNILVPSTSAIPIKPKRPKPRPAYRAYKEAMAAASATVSAIDHTNLESPHAPLTNTSFSLDIAERAKMRKRAATSDRTNGSEPIQSSISSKQESTIIEGYSRDVIVLYSSDAEGETQGGRGGAGQKLKEPRSSTRTDYLNTALGENMSSLAAPKPPSSVTNTGHDSSPFNDLGPGLQSTPPSSPFQPRKKKRKSRVEDFDFLDEGVGAVCDKSSSSISAITAEGPGAKKQKRSKEKKPRGKIEKGATGGDGMAHTKLPSAKAKKRQLKAKDNVPEPEFKSKEFIEDSDDDPLLLPGSSKSAPRLTRSDFASAEVSVDASVDLSVQPYAFLPIEPTIDPLSALQSISLSVGPSAAFSELPSADIPAPPPSPSRLPQRSRSSKPKPEKRKKKVIPMPDCTSTSNNRCDAPDYETRDAIADSKESCGAPVQPEKEATKAKQSKRAKSANNTSVSLDDGGKLPSSSSAISPPSYSTKQGIPVHGKSRPREKDRKKARALVSSDEESDKVEPIPLSSKEDEPAGMEVAAIETRVCKDVDKENRSVSPSNEQPQKTSASSSSSVSASASAIQARHTNPKPQVSTPKMPLRRDSMSLLIRRVSSKVQSPLGTPSPVYCHSPLAKASRAALSRIAPLHPNRRTPPPPPPRPPPPKKSKKMLDLEEKWEMELAESVDGWSCMTDEERAALRRAKRDAELGFDD